MSFEEILLNYWASCPALYDVVPFSSVFAGTETDAAMPFVTILQDGNKTACPTTAGRSPGVIMFRLELHHDHYDAMTELLRTLVDALNGVRITTETDGTFIFRYIERHHKRPGETHWVLTAVFRCITG